LVYADLRVIRVWIKSGAALAASIGVGVYTFHRTGEIGAALILSTIVFLALFTLLVVAMEAS
jgi:hypothetical protein